MAGQPAWETSNTAHRALQPNLFYFFHHPVFVLADRVAAALDDRRRRFWEFARLWPPTTRFRTSPYRIPATHFDSRYDGADWGGRGDGGALATHGWGEGQLGRRELHN